MKKVRFFNRWQIGVVCLAIILLVGSLPLILAWRYPPPEEQKWIPINVSVGPTIILVVIAISEWFQLFTFSEKGIERRIFFFFRSQILWDEMVEIRGETFYLGENVLVFSKIPLDDFAPLQIQHIRKIRKETLYVDYSTKLLKTLRLFCDKDITGLTREDEEMLLAMSEKKKQPKERKK